MASGGELSGTRVAVKSEVSSAESFSLNLLFREFSDGAGKLKFI